jgi:hypothetical protein
LNVIQQLPKRGCLRRALLVRVAWIPHFRLNRWERQIRRGPAL